MRQGRRASRAKRNFSLFRVFCVSYRVYEKRSIKIDRRRNSNEKKKEKNYHLEQLTCSTRSFAIIVFPFMKRSSLSSLSPTYVLFTSRDFLQLYRPKLIKYTVGSLILNYYSLRTLSPLSFSSIIIIIVCLVNGREDGMS